MLLKFWKKEPSPFASTRHPADIPWQRDDKGYFFRLLRLHPIEAGLSGVGGVYVIWHHGVHPQWIYVGATDDLGEAIAQARDAQDILTFEGRGSVYVTWAPFKAAYRNGVALYLRQTLKPQIETVFATDQAGAGAEPIAVLPPS